MHADHRTRRFAALTLAAALGACAGESMRSQYSEPYVVFEAEHRMSMQDIVPALAVAIDGKSVATGRKEPVKPGTHVVEVTITGLAAGNTKTVTVDAKPCTRYYLGAKRPGAGATDWTVSVTASEPIGECRKLPGS